MFSGISILTAIHDVAFRMQKHFHDAAFCNQQQFHELDKALQRIEQRTERLETKVDMLAGLLLESKQKP